MTAPYFSPLYVLCRQRAEVRKRRMAELLHLLQAHLLRHFLLKELLDELPAAQRVLLQVGLQSLREKATIRRRRGQETNTSLMSPAHLVLVRVQTFQRKSVPLGVEALLQTLKYTDTKVSRSPIDTPQFHVLRTSGCLDLQSKSWNPDHINPDYLLISNRL